MASIAERKSKVTGEVIGYQIKVSRGRDKLTGKQLTPYTMTWPVPQGWSKKAIERELNRVAGDFESRCRRGEVLTKDEQKAAEQARRDAEQKAAEEERRRPTFAQFAETFLSDMRAELKPKSIELYRHALYVARDNGLGEMKIVDIRRQDMQSYITRLKLDIPNANGERFSHGAIKTHYSALSHMFGYAVKMDVIESSPMNGVEVPKPRADEISKRDDRDKTYTEEEAAYIVECVVNEPPMWRALMMFTIDSGCRKGEVCGLQWSDIDFDNNTVTIRRNVGRAGGQEYICTPKNGESRTLTINKPAMTALRNWKRVQAEDLLAHGVPQSEWVFTQVKRHNNLRINNASVNKHMTAFADEYGIKHLYPHKLRHTLATICVINGVDIICVSKRLGHKQVSTTENIYVHMGEEAQKRAGDTINKVLYKREAM